MPLIKFDEIVMFGEITLTVWALHTFLERDIEITYLSHYGQLKKIYPSHFQKCCAPSGTVS